MGNDRLNQDLKMMQEPERWPMRPLLPIKNHTNREEGKFPKFAVMIFTEGKYRIVFAGFMDSPEDLAKAKQEEITPEKAIADGWIVD